MKRNPVNKKNFLDSIMDLQNQNLRGRSRNVLSLEKVAGNKDCHHWLSTTAIKNSET